ncbi:MAG: UDP-N-acetylmuramoyl-tripeptide--D-alanyl-D-alanine ligase [Acidobacteria bacterium]|nr:UDP-N-acetylmuramoyl-tripeptide--D-alanyl-D-alanine ligase [Acidobacteriota bacterium]
MTSPRLTLFQLAEILCGRLTGADADRPVAGLAIDTRKMEAYEVFFAVQGENTDGHRFLNAAWEAGAAGAVVSADRQCEDIPELPLIHVDDPREALLRFARWRIENWPGRVVGVTGSSGKTTTKEFIAALLRTRRKVFRTPGNLNNTLGVPLALFHLDDADEMAILEMGMSSPGEIAALCGVAAPDIALVTNVGSVHLQFFPDRNALARAKEEIVQGMKPTGTFVCNTDDPLVMAMARRSSAAKLFFGTDPMADVRLLGWRVEDVDRMAGSLSWGGRIHRLRLGMTGVHAFMNLAAAVAVCLAAGLDDASILEAAEALAPVGMRGAALRLAGGVRVLDDSYNSNPEAMRSVLTTLGAWEGRPETLLVAGEMRELGPGSADFHAEIGRRVAELGNVRLVGVAGDAREMAAEAERLGIPAEFHPDAAAATPAVIEAVRPGMLVVVKGSRGVGLERIVRALEGSLGPDRTEAEQSTAEGGQ